MAKTKEKPVAAIFRLYKGERSIIDKFVWIEKKRGKKISAAQVVRDALRYYYEECGQ